MAEYRPAGPYPIPGVKMPTWLVRFDEKGACVSPETKAALLKLVGTAPKKDVIFFSHGWKTDFGGALEQYGAFLQNLEAELDARRIDGKNFVFVGITWPSRWMASKPGPRMAGASNSEGEVADTIEDIGRGLSESDSRRFYELAAAVSLNEAEALELAKLLRLTIPSIGADEIGGDAALNDADIVKLWRDLPKAPGSDEDDFDAIGTIGAGAPNAGAGPGAAGEGGFDPADIIRTFSLYQMKDRAGKVGTNGVAKLLTDLTAAAKSVVVAGHSFGAKVMLSAVKGDLNRANKPKGLLLLQPAISHLCFAQDIGGGQPGGYEQVWRGIDGPIFTTFSKWDWPLHEIFHIALRRPADLGEVKTANDEPPNKYAALGGYGPRGAAETVSIPIPDPSVQIAVNGARIVALDGGSADKRIDGHMGVANKYTAWAMATLLRG